jgi:hypothetical protein
MTNMTINRVLAMVVAVTLNPVMAHMYSPNSHTLDTAVTRLETSVSARIRSSTIIWSDIKKERVCSCLYLATWKITRELRERDLPIWSPQRKWIVRSGWCHSETRGKEDQLDLGCSLQGR